MEDIFTRRRELLSRIQSGDVAITQSDLDAARVPRELLRRKEVCDLAKECAKYAEEPEDHEGSEHVHKMKRTLTSALIYKLGLPADDPYGHGHGHHGQAP